MNKIKRLNFIKKRPVLITILFSVAILGTVAVAVLAQEKQPIPKHLSLRATKEKILGYKQVDWLVENENGKSENKGKIIKYAYNSDTRINNEPSNEIIKQAQKSNLRITGEIINKRTKHSRTFATNIPRQFISEFISGAPQYYKDSSGNWWQADYGTTTIEAFGQQTKTNIISGLFIPEAYADSTFYPDANPETGSVDGYTREADQDESWANIINGAGTYASDTESIVNAILIWASGSTNYYAYNTRTILLFDTSPIPDEDIVESSTLSVATDSKQDDDNLQPDFNVYSSNPSSNTSLAASDYTSFGTTTFSTAISYSSVAAAGSYNNFSLNADGLNAVKKTAVSKFGLRNANYDVAESDPSAIGWTANSLSKINIRTADYANSTYDPKLVVVHASPFSLVVRKSSDQNSVSNTLQYDNELALQLASSTSYIVEGTLFAFSASTQPEIKIAFATSSPGVTMDIGYITSNGTGDLIELSDTPGAEIDISANKKTIIHIRGTLQTTSTSTSLFVKWAQSKSNQQYPTYITEGSYLKAEAIE